MRRRLAPILALVILAPLARAQAPAARRPRSALLAQLDVRDFGYDGQGDATAAIKATIATARRVAGKDPSRTPRVTAFLPAGDYHVSAPINVPSFVELKGEGGSTRIVMAHGRAFSPIVIGMNLDGLDPKYRPDLFGVLDATAAPAAGAIRGFRTWADGSLISPGTALSHGGFSPTEGRAVADRYFETKQLTVDLAVMAGDGRKFPGGCSVFTLGSDTTGPASPIALRTDGPNQWTFVVSTQSARFAEPRTVFFTFSSGDAVGLQRISLQLDMDRGTFAAFANGTQAATTALAQPTMSLAPGSSLNENRFEPFYVNNPRGGRKDFTLAGLCVSRTARYRDRGPGTRQARADGRAIADRYRYFPSFEDDPACIAHLGLAERDPTTRHMVAVGGGQAVGSPAMSAFVLAPGPDSNSAFARVTELAVQGNTGYGYGVMMGNNLETHFDGVIAYGGLYGVGNMPFGANYQVYVRDCTLAGSDCGYFGYTSLIDMERVTFPFNGRTALRLVGCNIAARGLFVTRASTPQYAFAMMHWGEYGGLYSFRDVTADNEGDPYTLAGIYCERHVTGTMLAPENVNLGTLGAAPLIMLKGMNPDWAGVAVLDARAVYGSGSGPLVQTDDGQWGGSIVKSPANVLPAVVSSGPASGIVAELPGYLTRNAKQAPAPPPAAAPGAPR